MHLQTKRNLHSHTFSSPLSHNQEVSGFGEEGVGDNGKFSVGSRKQETPLGS